jgi:hypothetical protein
LNSHISFDVVDEPSNV